MEVKYGEEWYKGVIDRVTNTARDGVKIRIYFEADDSDDWQVIKDNESIRKIVLGGGSEEGGGC